MKYILPQDNEINFFLRCEETSIQFFQNENYSDNEIFISGKIVSNLDTEFVKYNDWLANEDYEIPPHNFKFRMLIKLDKNLSVGFDGKVSFQNFMGNKDKHDKEVDPGLDIKMRVSSEKIFEALISKVNTTSTLNISLHVYIPSMHDNDLRVWDVKKDKEISITRYFLHNNNKLTNQE